MLEHLSIDSEIEGSNPVASCSNIVGRGTQLLILRSRAQIKLSVAVALLVELVTIDSEIEGSSPAASARSIVGRTLVF